MERGLKLCPTSRSFVFALLFQRGLLDVGAGAGRRDTRVAGVGVVVGTLLWLAVVVGDGIEDTDARGIDDFRTLKFDDDDDVGCGSPDNRRAFVLVVVVDRAVLPTELPRRLELPTFGVVEEPRTVPLPPMMTEDAGELPGVAMALPVAGLSIVMILEMESRSCWLLLMGVSSSNPSITFMLALSASTLDFMSESNVRISPLTVRRSLTPFWMIDNTRSMAGM